MGQTIDMNAQAQYKIQNYMDYQKGMAGNGKRVESPSDYGAGFGDANNFFTIQGPKIAFNQTGFGFSNGRSNEMHGGMRNKAKMTTLQ